MDSFLLLQAKEVIRKLGSKPIFRIFRSKDILMQYFPSIQRKDLKNWVDLKSIMVNLEKRKYKSKKEWIADVSMVWKPLLGLQPNNQLLVAVTHEFRNLAIKLVSDIPDNEHQQEIKSIQAIIQEMNLLTQRTINQDLTT